MTWCSSMPLLAVLAMVVACWIGHAGAMPSDRIVQLRQETVDMFYHGFDNYMKIAFPEDELRPVSCTPLARDAENPGNFALNDVLGNYSLTLIDSLSTLAILASAPPDDRGTGPRALQDFQHGVAALVQQYGDGRPGSSGRGLRARGFDLDSKVQVFETVIRGVGGLLSAHLFAVGELPIRGYDPGVAWPGGFRYDGQLLRLALDLAQRLLPAFYTTTGMPYPRVNLRRGIPFYANSPLHHESPGAGGSSGPGAEITETCSAGAGSLVLEFTVLSRLTGDPRFEQLAKRAFWAVWHRKSGIGLIGAGVDAEDGQWVGAYSVIGAGADSFFEYALKTHILLSGHELPNRTAAATTRPGDGWMDPNTIYPPLSDTENSPDSFLEAWHHAHAAIKRHLYNEREHPHYINVNLWTGSFASNWIDSLGAYYSGLLTIAGELDEAIETNLLYTAIWTRYAALPERWSLKDKTVEGGLGWWPLRPEFIESVYHIYRATKDPWYLYVGEMVLRDVARRCWTPCGWAGLQNVLDGEKSDRMESFFLGETAKYLYLLFDGDHPLNSFDAAYVFTTEGHPLIIPRAASREKTAAKKAATKKHSPPQAVPRTNDLIAPGDDDFTIVCPVPPSPLPLTGSAIAARPDIYHAARLLDLHLIPGIHYRPPSSSRSGPSAHRGLDADRSNYTFFPWTLPTEALPDNGTCSRVYQPMEISLEFGVGSDRAGGGGGSVFNFMLASQNLERISSDRIRVSSLSGLKITLRLEDGGQPEWRVTKVNGVPLGRDEHIIFERNVIGDVSDPRFNLARDPVHVKLQQLHRIDLPVNADVTDDGDGGDDDGDGGDNDGKTALLGAVKSTNTSVTGSRVTELGTRIKSMLRRVISSLDIQLPSPATPIPGMTATVTPHPYNFVVNRTAITPTGLGAAPLPDAVDDGDSGDRYRLPEFGPVPASLFPWDTIFAAGDACGAPLPEAAPRDHQVILIRRGGCSFSDKLARIPAYLPSPTSLQLVVVVSDDETADSRGSNGGNGSGSSGKSAPRGPTRPLLDEVQRTPKGVERRHPIAMVMVGGGDAAYHEMAVADRVGLTRTYYVESHGVRVGNIIVDDGEGATDA